MKIIDYMIQNNINPTRGGYKKRTRKTIRNKSICPKCKSNNIYRNGNQITRQGKTQRYICNDCGKTFQ